MDKSREMIGTGHQARHPAVSVGPRDDRRLRILFQRNQQTNSKHSRRARFCSTRRLRNTGRKQESRFATGSKDLVKAYETFWRGGDADRKSSPWRRR